MTTPGYWYAVAYWVGSMLMVGLNQRRLRGAKLAGVSLLFLSLLTLFMVATDGVDAVYFIPCMVLIFLLVCLHMLSLCEMGLCKAVYYSVHAFILGEFMASLAWQLAFYLGVTAGQRVTFLGQAALMAGVYGLTCVCIYWIEHRISADNDMLDIGWKEMVWALVIGLVIYALSNMSYISQDSPFSSRFPAEIFIIRTIADLGGVGALLAYHLMLRELQVNMEREYLKRLLHMQGENYRMAEESVALVNQKYHDLKHQITLLRSRMNAESGMAVLDQMENEIKAYEAQNKTGNKVLDTMLTAKSLQCQASRISLTCVADGHALDFMDPLDLSALFGNALDNAIESVAKIDDPGKRLIHVTVARQKQFVRVRVENCYIGELHFEHGAPATTKSDRRYHGYGVKSIRKIVEKYGGSTAIDAKDGWFELRILLPEQR
jgi:hypothetical protein